MKGLRKYTHAERARIVEELLPAIRRKFGENFIALAAQGSFARGEDFGYSDLELVAFVREMPVGKAWDGFGKIIDGLLIELVWMTRETYLERTREVTKDWFIAGSDILFPIINREFIDELNAYRVENLREKCLKEAKHRWSEVQESTAKTLNAIASENRENLPLLFGDMLVHMLVSLSFLNQTPYVTFAGFVTQARLFEIKPASFERLLDAPRYFQNLPELEKIIERVFAEFEGIFENQGVELYDKNLNL
jgi:hypothetical protein